MLVKNKLFIFLLLGMFLISLVSSQGFVENFSSTANISSTTLDLTPNDSYRLKGHFDFNDVNDIESSCGGNTACIGQNISTSKCVSTLDTANTRWRIVCPSYTGADFDVGSSSRTFAKYYIDIESLGLDNRAWIDIYGEGGYSGTSYQHSRFTKATANCNTYKNGYEWNGGAWITATGSTYLNCGTPSTDILVNSNYDNKGVTSITGLTGSPTFTPVSYNNLFTIKGWSSGYTGAVTFSLDYFYRDFDTGGQITSKVINNPENIETVNYVINDNIPSQTNITYYVSNDGGFAFYPIDRAVTRLTFGTTGSSFVWKAVVNSTNVSVSPEIYDLAFYFNNDFNLTIGNTYSNLIYNITLRNENTNALIPNNNVTMAYSIDYGFDINSILGTANFNDNKLLNKNISSNIFSQLYLAGDIIFSATDFIGRNYYFVENSIISPKNVTLYLSYENESYVKSIIVTDEGGRGVPALYEQYRNINGVDVLIASEVLDQTGKSNIVFTPNVQYTFKFYSDTCQNATKNIMFYDQTDYTQVLSCSSYNPDDWVDEFKDMQVSFSPNGLFYVDNDTEGDDSTFYANVSGSSAFCDSINTVVFNIYNSSGDLIGSDTANSCDKLSDSGYFDLFATATLYILLDSGEEQTLGFRWQKLYFNKDYSGYNILDLLQEVGESDDILGIDWKFKLLFCFIGLFGIIIALTAYQRIYNFSNTATLIICDAYIWFMCFIGWGSLDFGKVGGGFTTFISQYALFILAVVGTVGVLSNKEDEYS